MGQELENLAFIEIGPPYVHYVHYVLQNSNFSPYYLLVSISWLAKTKTPAVLWLVSQFNSTLKLQTILPYVHVTPAMSLIQPKDQKEKEL